MERYEPRMEIASLDSFDSADEFYSHHISWSFGKVSDTRVFEPVYFDAGIASIDKSYDYDTHHLKWSLRIIREGETNVLQKFIIDIQNKDEIGFPIEILHRMPIIARLGIDEEDGRGDVKLLSARVMYGQEVWKFAPDELKDFTDVVFHLWLDVPTSVRDGDRQIEVYGRPKSRRDLAFSSIAGLFKEVKGKTAGTSDITLITDSQDGTKTEDQDESTKSESQDGATKTTKERRFFCHRPILAARSSVFKTMMVNSQFKESGERDVKIEDVDGEAMYAVLKYMYKGECGTVPIEILPKVIHAAEKYNLPELKDECAFRLLTDDAITDDAWIECLRMAEMYNMASFKAVCILALSTNMRLFGDTQVRERISEQSMRDLMEMATKRATITEMKELTTTWTEGADSDADD